MRADGPGESSYWMERAVPGMGLPQGFFGERKPWARVHRGAKRFRRWATAEGYPTDNIQIMNTFIRHQVRCTTSVPESSTPTTGRRARFPYHEHTKIAYA